MLFVAVDLGAGSGRVVLGGFADDAVHLREVHRFLHPMAVSAGHLRWDPRHILAGIKTGIARAAAAAREMGEPIRSIGIDSWGVDYGLVDAAGRLLEAPICYRDERTLGRMEEVFQQVPRREVFARTGIQFLGLNTLYQLVAHVRSGGMPRGTARLLMIPDLFHAALGGRPCGEYTNATTTQLVSAATGDWDRVLVDRLGLPGEILPPIVQPGTPLGALGPGVCEELDVPPIDLVAPATHDTASAVAATPLERGWAYLSSGTWSLLGVERAAPILTDAAYEANLTNEGGAGGRITLHENVAGLWILEACRRQWQARGAVLAYDVLAQALGTPRPPGALVEPDHSRFFNPPDMVAEIQASLRESGQTVPGDEVAVTRVILDSLAARYATVVDQVEAVTGEPIAGIRIVGGGSRNAYLNQATADACRRPVVAGPVEATSIGNLVVQAMAAGRFESLAEARAYLARHLPAREYHPAGDV